MITKILPICLLLSAPVLAQQVSLPITADNSIVDNDGERSVNMGAATSLRLKAFQHHLVLKVDTAGMDGKKAIAAVLRYRRNSETLEHVTVSSIQGDWVEGDSAGFNTVAGTSCFLAAQYDQDPSGLIPWSFPGSRFVDVVYGNGFSIMGTSDSPVSGGYYEWQVPADVVNAIAIGASYGIAVFESSGRVDRNPTVYSREASGPAPELVVTTTSADPAPGPVENLHVDNNGVDLGQARIRFTVPQNAFAYTLTIQGGSFASPTPVPRYLLPFAGQAGTEQSILIRDILEPAQDYTILLTVISRGGATSQAQEISIRAADMDTYPNPDLSVDLPPSSGNGYEQAGLRVWAAPVTDKVLPDGSVFETVPADYQVHNPVFDGTTISLTGAKNDLLSFQLVLEDEGTSIQQLSVSAQVEDFQVSLHPIAFVNTDSGFFPELLRDPQVFYSTNMDENVSAEQHAQSVLVEIYVPKDASVGTHLGTLAVAGPQVSLEIPIRLDTADFSVPDFPTFKLEQNDYGYPNYLATFNALQVVAHRYRAHVNLVPYSQSTRTRMDMYMPDGSQMNEAEYNDFTPGQTTGHWDDFSAGFLPLFDGSLFSQGPWANTPVPGFYLTFHESWPLFAKDHYTTGTKDAFEAFDAAYETTYKGVLADFVQLAKSYGWDRAGFQVYLNNKPNSNDPPFTIIDGSTPWTLDEPFDFWDFRALGYFGTLFKEGAGDHDPVKIRYRIDISRFPYHRGQLDDLVDLAVVNRDLYVFKRLVFDKAKRENMEIWNYGTANRVDRSNLSAAGWVLSCYAMGGRGVLPWSTVKYGSEYLQGVTGNDRQQRALFVVTSDSQSPRVYASYRLAAFRDAQLISEYLEGLRIRGGYTQGQMERLITHYLDLDAAFSISGQYQEDAGTISFDDLTSTQLWKLRRHVLQSLGGGSEADGFTDDGGSLQDAGTDGGADANADSSTSDLDTSDAGADTMASDQSTEDKHSSIEGSCGCQSGSVGFSFLMLFTLGLLTAFHIIPIRPTTRK